MASVDLTALKKLRAETGVSVSDCRRALEDASGNYQKALTLLKSQAVEKAEKKADRATGEGLIEAYIHGNRKIGTLVELHCETDFVARTDEFKHLAHELAMQIAAMDPKSVDDLLQQDYIKDPSLKISEYIKSVIQKTGENIVLKRFQRYSL